MSHAFDQRPALCAGEPPLERTGDVPCTGIGYFRKRRPALVRFKKRLARIPQKNRPRSARSAVHDMYETCGLEQACASMAPAATMPVARSPSASAWQPTSGVNRLRRAKAHPDLADWLTPAGQQIATHIVALVCPTFHVSSRCSELPPRSERRRFEQRQRSHEPLHNPVDARTTAPAIASAPVCSTQGTS